MTHDSSCLVLDWSPTFFVSSGYKIRSNLPNGSAYLHSRSTSSINSGKQVSWVPDDCSIFERGSGTIFFSIVVFEKLSRNVSTKMSWFQCTSWNSLVQLTTSNEPKVAVAVECDAIAVMDFPVGTRKAVPWTMIPCHWVAEVNPKVPSLNEIWHTLARERL